VRGYLDFVEAHGRPYLNLFHSALTAETQFVALCESTREILVDNFVTALRGSDPARAPALRLSLRGYLGYSESVILSWLERRQVSRETLDGLLLAAILSAVRSMGLASEIEPQISPRTPPGSSVATGGASGSRDPQRFARAAGRVALRTPALSRVAISLRRWHILPVARLTRRVREPEISVRLLWPFVRAVGIDVPSLMLFQQAGFPLAHFTGPDARVPYRLVVESLASYVERTGDGAVGLRAGTAVEPTDLEPLELAARCCATVGDSIGLFARFTTLMNDAVEISLIDVGAGASLLCFRVVDDVPALPAANDFMMASGIAFARRTAGPEQAALEVHLAHPRPAYASSYEQVIDGKIRFDMPHTGFLLPREWLARELPRPQPEVLKIIEETLRQRVEGLAQEFRREVKARLVILLPSGEFSMSSVAHAMGVSTMTLRRRLAEEGTTYAEIVDETRRQLALSYLRAGRLSVSKITLLLGFAFVPGFIRAFRRWTGTTPSAFLAEQGTEDAAVAEPT
jgi:AraC-like DNA-binding protein